MRVKVEAAKAQKDRDIEQKLSERESLIAEARRNDELLQTAQETLDYFTAMQELGEIKDPADVKKLEEMEALVGSLEKQRLEIDRKIGLIESRPEILGKLYDAAKYEDVERTLKKEIDQAHEELDPQTDQLAQSIKSLAEVGRSIFEQRERQEEEIPSARRKINDLFVQAGNMLGKRSEFGHVLFDNIFRVSGSPEEMLQKLSEEREKLRWFQGKEKAAVDFILSKTQEFEEYKLANGRAANVAQQLENSKTNEVRLAEQYKTIILRSWEAQNKINKLTGRGPQTSDLPSGLSSRIRDRMDDFMDIKRWRGGKEIGKYDGRYDAGRNPENRILSATWERVREAAGGRNLIYHNPEVVAAKEQH